MKHSVFAGLALLWGAALAQEYIEMVYKFGSTDVRFNAYAQRGHSSSVVAINSKTASVQRVGIVGSSNNAKSAFKKGSIFFWTYYSPVQICLFVGK